MPRPRSISVIIPAYNEAWFLERTLAHLAGCRACLEPGLSLEVIVSDDGSRDATVELARGLADRLVLPRPGQRTGAGAARNRGAAAARGDLLLFQDADILLEDPARFLARAARAFGDPRLAGATSRMAVYPWEATLPEKMLLRLQDEVIRVENAAGINTAGGWCQMVRRELFLRVGGYDEDLTISQDVDLFLKLGRLGHTRLLPYLRVLESPRRYRETGLVRTYLIRYLNAVAVTFGLRPPVRAYRAARPRFH